MLDDGGCEEGCAGFGACCGEVCLSLMLTVIGK